MNFSCLQLVTGSFCTIGKVGLFGETYEKLGCLNHHSCYFNTVRLLYGIFLLLYCIKSSYLYICIFILLWIFLYALSTYYYGCNV